MRRARQAWTLGFFLIFFTATTSAWAQRELVERAIAETRAFGHEDAIVHMAEEIGAQGIEECLRHASRAGRAICAQSARYLERPWEVLSVLASVIQDHDRQVASRAAESMVIILSGLEPDDLGAQEAIPSEAEELLQGLRGLANDERLSPDLIVQVVIAASSLARLVGASQLVARESLRHPEVTVRRAAAASLVGSNDRADLEALVSASADERDALTAATAAAGVCEATAMNGQPVPESVVGRVRAFLDDGGMRPALIGPLLTCLARSTTPQLNALRELAARHPNQGSRAYWQELRSNDRRPR